MKVATCILQPDWRAKFNGQNLKRWSPKIYPKSNSFSIWRSHPCPGSVTYNSDHVADETMQIMLPEVPADDVILSLPSHIRPSGLSPERKWYLLETTRPLVLDYEHPVLCPQPLSNRATFADTTTTTDEHPQRWRSPKRQELIRRWDSERELLRSAPLKLPEFAEITQNNGHYAVQGHSRSPILVPIESSYTISY